jgi:hypothetical protein
MKWISENDANTKFFHFKSSRTSRPNVGNLKFNQLVLELLAEKNIKKISACNRTGGLEKPPIYWFFQFLVVLTGLIAWPIQHSNQTGHPSGSRPDRGPVFKTLSDVEANILVAAFGYKEIRKAVWDCNCFKSWVSWMV